MHLSTPESFSYGQRKALACAAKYADLVNSYVFFYILSAHHFAELFIKGNPILNESMVTFQLQFGIILLLFYLRKRFFRLFLQLCIGIRHFKLHDNGNPIIRGRQEQKIASSQSAFTVGFDGIAIHHFKQASQEAMVVILTVIIKTDCLHQVYGQLPFQQLCVLFQQRTVNPGQILLPDFFIEPVQNRILVYIFYFQVGNCQRQVGGYILQTFLHFFSGIL